MFRYILYITVFLFPLPVQAQDYTGQLSGAIRIYRDGMPIPVDNTDAGYILLRMIKLFNSSTDNTAHSRIFRQSLTRDGGTIEDQWTHLKESGDYFSALLHPPRANFVDSVTLEELVVSIAPTPQDNPIGVVMVKLRDGEVRAYQVDQKKLINLYCLDRAQRYLPLHYNGFFEKYRSPNYIEQGIACVTQQQ